MHDFSMLMEKHKKIALSFSGGKDSMACVYLLRPLLSYITLYHNDTSDLFPEVMEVVEHVKGFAPHFVHLKGDVRAWQRINGLPTDLFPHSAHQLGALMEEGHGVKLSQRYDCCWQNLMFPLIDRIMRDGNTLLIRGTKASDMKKLPAKTGDVLHGIECYYPLEHWSDERVFGFLKEQGAPVHRLYEHMSQSPECMGCTAWWNVSAANYLRQYHPAQFSDWRARMAQVIGELEEPIELLRRERARAGI